MRATAVKQLDLANDKTAVKSLSKVMPVASNSSLSATSATSGRTIHTLCTSNGSPYLNYQTRIM